MTKPRQCVEFFSEWCEEGHVTDEGVIENVLLCGNRSKNGYEIPEKAFVDENHVKSLYGDKMVFFNHSDSPQHRDLLRDLAGVIRNPRLVGGKPRGDIHTKGTPAGEHLLKIASIKPPPAGLGMSHVAAYTFADRREESVAKVEQVVSVDIVMTPATTKTLFENTNSRKEMDLEQLNEELKQVRAERDLKASEARTASEKLATLESEHKTALEALEASRKAEAALKARVESYEAQEAVAARKAEVVKELQDAGLDPADPAFVTPRWLESLIHCADAGQRKADIAERAELLRRATSESLNDARRKPSEGWSADAALETLSL